MDKSVQYNLHTQWHQRRYDQMSILYPCFQLFKQLIESMMQRPTDAMAYARFHINIAEIYAERKQTKSAWRTAHGFQCLSQRYGESRKRWQIKIYIYFFPNIFFFQIFFFPNFFFLIFLFKYFFFNIFFFIMWDISSQT